ncbi:hypothetical protein PAXINDRAFT_20146 [Paxillus involutus ATCC 200175]|uniref:Uncharacterized protein n=1 Tax=Paxillus involutus ATCC 200175 TaxID=664439 RepID=A0A0C9TEW2_PAXIN|nr:hypothetical protein PAXINDRAFT_20146 [Paxillus involutus ATCC 200175]
MTPPLDFTWNNPEYTLANTNFSAMLHGDHAGNMLQAPGHLDTTANWTGSVDASGLPSNWSYSGQLHNSPASSLYSSAYTPTPASNPAAGSFDLMGNSLPQFRGNFAQAHGKSVANQSFQAPQFNFSSSQQTALPPSLPSPAVSTPTLPPLITRPPSEQGPSPDPQNDHDADADAPSGRSKRRPVPSQRAQRDNAIGEVVRDNHTLQPVEKSEKKKKKKRSADSVGDEGSKKSKKKKVKTT